MSVFCLNNRFVYMFCSLVLINSLKTNRLFVCTATQIIHVFEIDDQFDKTGITLWDLGKGNAVWLMTSV